MSDLCREVGLPDEAIKESLEWPGWQAGHFRRLVDRFTAVVDQSTDNSLRETHSRWQAELPDERAARRRRRTEVRRHIKELELRLADAVVAGTGLDAGRVDLLARYESTILRKLDRTLRALRSLQPDRERRGIDRGELGSNGSA